MAYTEEEQPSQAVPLSKIDYFIGSENYVNSITLPTAEEASKQGIVDENYDELIKSECDKLYSQAIKWEIKVDKITAANFSVVKGNILKRIRKSVEEFQEEAEEVPSGGLPPPVGTKRVVVQEGKKK